MEAANAEVNAAKNAQKAAGQQQAVNKGGNKGGGNKEGGNKGGGNKGNKEGPPAGAWTCIDCGNINWPQRETCNTRDCKAARPDSTNGDSSLACEYIKECLWVLERSSSGG